MLKRDSQIETPRVRPQMKAREPRTKGIKSFFRLSLSITRYPVCDFFPIPFRYSVHQNPPRHCSFIIQSPLPPKSQILLRPIRLPPLIQNIQPDQHPLTPHNNQHKLTQSRPRPRERTQDTVMAIPNRRLESRHMLIQRIMEIDFRLPHIGLYILQNIAGSFLEFYGSFDGRYALEKRLVA